MEIIEIADNEEWPEGFDQPCTYEEFKEFIKFKDSEIDVNEVPVISIHDLGIIL